MSYPTLLLSLLLPASINGQHDCDAMSVYNCLGYVGCRVCVNETTSTNMCVANEEAEGYSRCVAHHVAEDPTIALLEPSEAALAERIRVAKFAPCGDGACEKPPMKYERIQEVQPGFQWGDAGGYCGSWSIQRAALSKGAWISQQQVRDHTSPAPGAPPSHDNEILSPNIDEALKKLKLKAEHFDFRTSPTPQQPAYFKWLKRQLVSNATVVWMIMWDGQKYPAYEMKAPDGVHGHIEPVIGVMSNHALSDETVYDDDVFVHYTDNGDDAVYKRVSTLSGDWAPGGRAQCHKSSRYCIGPYGYGWGVHGFLLDQHEARAAHAWLKIQPFEREPDFRRHEAPIELAGTLTAERLTPGGKYAVFRWDSVDEAFTYKPAYKISTFTAPPWGRHVFHDPKPFANNGTTYYRCVEERFV